VNSPYLTTDEAAGIIRKTPDYIARQCAKKTLRAKKLGNDWRIHREDLDAFMRAGGKAPATRTRRRRAA
jgi:excisionase family DNA binding protein